MNSSVYKEHKHAVAYVLQWEGDPMIALFSISLQVVMLRMGHTQDYIHFELNKVLKDFNES